jgi:hypothetical protein
VLLINRQQIGRDIRAQLGADRFGTAWTQGRVSTSEAAVDKTIFMAEAALRA